MRSRVKSRVRSRVRSRMRSRPKNGPKKRPKTRSKTRPNRDLLRRRSWVYFQIESLDDHRDVAQENTLADKSSSRLNERTFISFIIRVHCLHGDFCRCMTGTQKFFYCAVSRRWAGGGLSGWEASNQIPEVLVLKFCSAKSGESPKCLQRVFYNVESTFWRTGKSWAICRLCRRHRFTAKS